MRFQHATLYGSDPGPGDSCTGAIGRRQVIGGQGPALPHLFEHPRGIVRALFQNLCESPWPHPIRLTPISQQRPSLRGDDRNLVGPVLGELTGAVDQLVECGAIIRPYARERHHMLRLAHYVHAVDLQQP
jgi:hypothetical protein